MHSSKNHRKKEEKEIYSEEEETDQEEEYVPESDIEENDSSLEDETSSSSETDREGSERMSPAKAVSQLKRKKQVKKGKEDIDTKKRKTHKRENDEEIKHSSLNQKEPAKDKEDNKECSKEKDSETDQKGKKKNQIFNDRNVDLDLFNSSPNNVKPQKIKVSNNLLVTCRNIDQVEGARAAGVSYDFAALTFQRKTNNDKMFEFVVPLALATRIKEAIEHIIKENPKFFNNSKASN